MNSTTGARPPTANQPRLGWTLLTLAYAAAIFGLSSIPGRDIPLPTGTDKIAHFVEYVGLGFLATRATGTALSGFLIAAVYGALDESHQAWVPGRSPDIADWVVDVTAALAGVAVSLHFRRRMPGRTVRP